MENICKKGKNMKVMVVSPHPDDETLGAGGTLLRLKKEGHQIYWLNITDAKEKDGWSASFIKQRKEQIQRVCDFFEFDDTFNLKFPPAKLEMLEKSILIQKIGSCFQTVEPEWIIYQTQMMHIQIIKLHMKVAYRVQKFFGIPIFTELQQWKFCQRQILVG